MTRHAIDQAGCKQYKYLQTHAGGTLQSFGIFFFVACVVFSFIVAIISAI
jgi:hypothetical protein